MSIALSIYSRKAFREVTLPEQGQSNLQIVIQKELYALNQDLTLNLTREDDEWTLRPLRASIILAGNRLARTELYDGLRFRIETSSRQQVAVIVFAQNSPFAAYQKYDLTGIQRINIGHDPDKNHISYQNDFVGGEHCSISVQNGQAILHDHNSRNGTYLNFQRVQGKAPLKYGDSIRVMRLNIIYLGNMIAINDCDNLRVKFQALKGKEINERLAGPKSSSKQERVLFHRSPRNLRKLNTEPFEIEPPPGLQEYQDAPLAMMIGPSLTMAIPMVLGSSLSIWASRASGAHSSAFMYMGMVTALTSALIGAMWAVINLRHSMKMRRKIENRRFESYSEYLIRTRDRIEMAYNENTEAMKERYLSAEACCALDERSPLLWNRNAFHDDFLSVRLGIGDMPFQANIVIPKERFSVLNDSLAEKPQVIREDFRTLKDVPITVDLLQNRLVGVAGGENRKDAIAIVRAMIAQIAASNCYTEVKIGVIYDNNSDIDRNVWDFAQWLPHVWSGDKKIRYMATNQEERGDVFYALTQIMRNRSEEEREQSLKPRFVLFVTDPTLLDGEAISHYIYSRGRDLGLTAVLLSERPEELPNECECVIECDRQFQGLYYTKSGREEGAKIRFDRISNENLSQFAKNLGRIEVVESDQEGEIPNSLTFFDMYGVSHPEELNAPERWKKSNSIASMKALVGFQNGNAPCYLDINEKYHGPHGLVAGTTGSGKSETLQTYILSLAINFSPEDIGFFVIDYKGGGMANLFVNLPHLIGSISNLSGNQVKRAMVSIQSENRRRQRIFTEYGVNNINSYTALYKRGDAAEAVPHLFIIIDEFAELKREEPEFMKELISVAQVGRSLGVHLILSTQRPSGTVDENIRANSKFRLCLRVQDRQDSLDMLSRPEAAYLTQAGRCYLQVGNDEIFELFQSGFSGAPYDEEFGGSSLELAQMLSMTGKADLAGSRAKRKRKEALRLKWVRDLVGFLRQAEEKSGISASTENFIFSEHPEFMTAFYNAIQAAHPDFECNPFNNARVQELCEVYRLCADISETEKAAERIIRMADKPERGKKKRLPEIQTKTQLEATVDYLKAEAESLRARGHLQEIPKLWLPVLPEYLYLEDLEIENAESEDAKRFKTVAFDGKEWPAAPHGFRLVAPIGMADDPENQAQQSVSLDFSLGGHHLLLGTVSTGKSTFLQTVVYSLAALYTPNLLNIYCLDFSGKLLSVFDHLKHVGAYMDETALENDTISKFFTMMGQILDQRKQLLAGTSFGDYVNHNGWTLPSVLIVIDNYGNFHEKTGEAYEAIMSRIVKEGNSYGIFLLVSAGGIGMQEMPSRLAENFRTGVALEMQDQFAYADILHVVKPPVMPESRVKGRGLMYCGERILEFQTALAARAEGAPERNDLLREAVERMNAAWKGSVAKPVPRIPEKPVWSEFAALPEYAEAMEKPELMPIGYDFEYATVYSFDLSKNFAYLITGSKRSGKTVLMENLMRNALARKDRIWIVDLQSDAYAAFEEAHRSELLEDGKKRVERFTDGAKLFEMLKTLDSELRGVRGGLKMSCKGLPDEELFQRTQENPRIDIFIGDMGAFVKELNEPPARDGRGLFEAFCDRGKGYNIFLYAEVDDKDHETLRGHTCFDNLRNYRSGIRFGGRFREQKELPFENIRFQEQERAMKEGVGVIPSGSQDERLIKVVVPMP